MIYSAAFDGMPDIVRERVYQRLYDVLTGKDKSPTFAGISAADRQAILEIVRATKPKLPAYWATPIESGSNNRMNKFVIAMDAGIDRNWGFARNNCNISYLGGILGMSGHGPGGAETSMTITTSFRFDATMTLSWLPRHTSPPVRHPRKCLMRLGNEHFSINTASPATTKSSKQRGWSWTSWTPRTWTSTRKSGNRWFASCAPA